MVSNFSIIPEACFLQHLPVWVTCVCFNGWSESSPIRQEVLEGQEERPVLKEISGPPSEEHSAFHIRCSIKVCQMKEERNECIRNSIFKFLQPESSSYPQLSVHFGT